MDRLASFILVRRGYDLLLWTNAGLGLCWLLQSPNRTNTAAAYQGLKNVLDPVLPGYYLRWFGALAIVLALGGYFALSSGRHHLGTLFETLLSIFYFVFAISAVWGARNYTAGWSAVVIWISFAYAHLQASYRDKTGQSVPEEKP